VGGLRITSARKRADYPFKLTVTEDRWREIAKSTMERRENRGPRALGAIGIAGFEGEQANLCSKMAAATFLGRFT